jgi:hypothetical protein
MGSMALLIASLVAPAIGTLPGLPKEIGTAISAIVATIGVLIKNGIGSGQAVTETAVLATLAGVIAQLKNTPGLSASALADVAVLDDALNAALGLKVTSVDPAQLQPITPVP